MSPHSIALYVQLHQVDILLHGGLQRFENLYVVSSHLSLTQPWLPSPYLKLDFRLCDILLTATSVGDLLRFLQL